MNLTPAYVWWNTSLSEREAMYISRCWYEGRFTPSGEIACICRSNFEPRGCEDEFVCDVIACALLAPDARWSPVAHLSDEEISDQLAIEFVMMPLVRMVKGAAS